MKKRLSFKEGEDFYRAVLPEYKALNAKRFSYSVSKDDLSVSFDIDADDAVAMKAATSSINKLHSIFTKMRDLDE